MLGKTLYKIKFCLESSLVELTVTDRQQAYRPLSIIHVFKPEHGF